MYLIPLGLFIKTWGLATLPSGLSATIPDLSLTWANLAWSLVPVTLGTLIGGAGLVGAVYWFVYLRSQRRA
jgi:formate/nitrite transporter FocA (FNT family)